MHWDLPLERPLAFAVQGVLYLTDTTAEMGAFTCVPGFHRKTEAWLENLPADANPRKQNLMNLGVKPIPGKAGGPHHLARCTASRCRAEYSETAPGCAVHQYVPGEGKG